MESPRPVLYVFIPECGDVRHLEFCAETYATFSFRVLYGGTPSHLKRSEPLYANRAPYARAASTTASPRVRDDAARRPRKTTRESATDRRFSSGGVGSSPSVAVDTANDL